MISTGSGFHGGAAAPLLGAMRELYKDQAHRFLVVGVNTANMKVHTQTSNRIICNYVISSFLPFRPVVAVTCHYYIKLRIPNVHVHLLQVFVVLSVLASVCVAQLPVPGTIPSLSLEQQYEYILQLQRHINQQVQWNGIQKRSLPVPGTTGLVPGSAAEAQWYQQQLAQIALINGRKKRSLPVPGTIPGLVPGSAAEAYWYQAQLAQIANHGK